MERNAQKKVVEYPQEVQKVRTQLLVGIGGTGSGFVYTPMIYMQKQRQETPIFICVSLGDIECVFAQTAILCQTFFKYINLKCIRKVSQKQSLSKKYQFFKDLLCANRNGKTFLLLKEGICKTDYAVKHEIPTKTQVLTKYELMHLLSKTRILIMATKKWFEILLNKTYRFMLSLVEAKGYLFLCRKQMFVTRQKIQLEHLVLLSCLRHLKSHISKLTIRTYFSNHTHCGKLHGNTKKYYKGIQTINNITYNNSMLYWINA